MNSGEPEVLQLLHVGEETGLVLTPSGRIERVNDPDRSHGPRLNFAGCVQGNVARVHKDVPDEIAAQLLAVAKEEPPWSSADTEPKCLERLVALLETHKPVTHVELEVDHRIPNALRYDHSSAIVRSDTAEGAAFAALFAREGMPQSMIDAGFKSVADLWPPWCIALDGETVASIAFSARLGARGAAIGVYTFPGHRGRGLAAAATSAWSSLRALSRHVLFYSARRDNLSSRRVIERLGLPRIGASLRID
jgi:hypothetical protein